VVEFKSATKTEGPGGGAGIGSPFHEEMRAAVPPGPGLSHAPSDRSWTGQLELLDMGLPLFLGVCKARDP
jgi:hypothetical protein